MAKQQQEEEQVHGGWSAGTRGASWGEGVAGAIYLQTANSQICIRIVSYRIKRLRSLIR